MAIRSNVADERGNGVGLARGHTDHGRGKGLGHEKRAEEAMADGEYGLEISGVNHINHTSANSTTGQVTLADGTRINTEVRDGEISIRQAPLGGPDSDALFLDTDNGNGRLRLNVNFDSDNQIKLGDLDTLNFDYFIQSSSQNNQIPVVRLLIDADGDLNTTNDRGELVFEWAYQGFGSTTQGSWQNADLVGGDWVAWQRSFGQNRDQISNMTEFSDWSDANGFTPTGGLNFNANSLVLGWSVAVGSGNGANEVFLDDLQIGGVVYDFTL
jgi:hypothetical protein